MAQFTNHPRIEMVRLSDLKPDPKNPRKHNKKQIEQLVSNMRRLGFRGALLVDEQNRIIAGLARWLAAKELGMEMVPVIRERFLSEEDRVAYIIGDNRLAELSEWDEDLLKNSLTDLFDAGFDIEITGFTTADLDFSLEVSKGEDEPVELPAGDERAVSRIGDLWFVGPHRIYCGDARDSVSYDALMGEERAALIVADVPYNVRIAGNVSGLGKKTHREFCAASGELTQAEFTAFLRAIFRNCVCFSADGSIHFMFMDWRHMREMLDASDGVYTELKQLLIWNKQVGAMGTFYRSQHELVFVFKSGRARHINTFGLGGKGRYRTNVIDHPGANVFRKGRQADLDAHPTVKPTGLLADLILDCSNRGDLVLDPCLGSGSTLLAAHKTHRIGVGIELDPLYCDVALRRLSEASGLPIVHADGRSFDEVAAERLDQTEG
ncbi:MAG: ParB N-terminal domain-containing protein [Sphingobium sp.]|nr:ParB N-terminal domain-containing protein [Sphingobium sp.]MBP9158964.1 ParB N-terminal domain-containing protein [Sphingobium sp.]